MNHHINPPCRERSRKDHLFCVLRDVDKTTSARQLRSEFTDIQIAETIHLGQPQKGNVEPPLHGKNRIARVGR